MKGYIDYFRLSIKDFSSRRVKKEIDFDCLPLKIARS